MSHGITISVKCPMCGSSLMDESVSIDGLPAIWLEARFGGKVGTVYLSQIYGSFSKRFQGIEDSKGSIADLCCPFCHECFPVHRICDCRAPVIGLQLLIGGTIKLCTRNGCEHHSLEFERVADAFALFQSQNRSGLF